MFGYSPFSAGPFSQNPLYVITVSVSETASGLDSVAASQIFVSAFEDSAAGADAASTAQTISVQFAATANAADSVSANIQSLQFVSEAAFAQDVFSSSPLWIPVDDTQASNWQTTSNAQNPGWTPVVDNGNGGWQLINTAQNPSWSALSNPSNPNWTEIDT